jgi:uncharacterized membrane protein (UPF0127 family)
MAAPTKLIVNATRGTVICEHAEIASTPWRRTRGLLGRSGLGEGEGMLIDPAPSIHSAFMRFEFDAVFLDRDLKVVKVVERIRPFRAHSAKRARKVLELAAGEAGRRGLQVGDTLAIEPRPEPSGADQAGSAVRDEATERHGITSGYDGRSTEIDPSTTPEEEESMTPEQAR